MCHTFNLKFVLATLGALTMVTSCQLEPLGDDWTKEEYTRNFIKNFGLIDPQQDWNMAKAAVVTVNIGEEKVSELKVYGKQGSKYYLIADLEDASGKIDIPVDIPKDCSDLLIKADGRKHYGSVGEVVDLTVKSRADLGTGTTYNPRRDNSNLDLDDFSSNSVQNGYSISRKYTHSAKEGTYKEYQYFNTQQMAPIVTPEGEEWADYYSLNQEKMVYNTNHDGGLLPESGIFTRKISDFTDHVNDMRARGHTMTYDFTVTVQDGTFTFFPYYYGTNFTHDLGIYLLDKDGNPILKNGNTYNSSAQYDPLTDFVCFKVFEDRQAGDLQVQPHYYKDVTSKKVNSIKVKARYAGTDTYYEGEDEDGFLEAGQFLNLVVGDKIQFEVWAFDENDNELFSNTNGDESSARFFDTYHTRIAYHAWDHNKNTNAEPTTFATITKDGLMEAIVPTTDLVDNIDDYANGFGFMDITVGSETRTTTFTGYDGVSTVIGPGLNLQVKIVDRASVSDSGISDIQLNPSNNTNGEKLRYDTFNEGSNIVFYVPVNETVTLPVVTYAGEGVNKTLTTDATKRADLICLNNDTQHYTMTNDGGDIKVTAERVCTATDPDEDSVPWSNIYIESNGTPGFQNQYDPNLVGDYDTPALGFKIIVYDPTVSTDTSHKHTENISQSSATDDIRNIWSGYFTSTNIHVSNENTNIFSAPKRSASGQTIEEQVWSGSFSLNWDEDGSGKFNTQLSSPSAWPSDLSPYSTLKVELTHGSYASFQICAQTDDGWKQTEYGSSDVSNVLEFSLDDFYIGNYSSNLRTIIQNYGIIFQGSDATLTRISLVGIATTPPPAENTLVEALETHHKTAGPANNNCDFGHSGVEHNFSVITAKDYDVKVVLGNNASAENIDYTVIWSYTSVSTTTSYNQGKSCSTWASRAPKRNAKRAVSRADGKPALLNDVNSWTDVNAAWSKYLPKGEEVSSYPPNQPMLGRTRGYDVFINYNGEPFNGKVGMYLTTKKIIKLGDNSGELELADLDSSLGSSYTLYSQSKYNFAETGSTPSHQPAAISFKHPTSSRTFFAFEDRRLDHNNPPYSYWDDSSDNDVNDMIFLLANYDAIEGEGDTITEEDELIEDGFPWIWAVEDLGSTDDFDFNDLVVQIKSVTQIKKRTTPSTSDDVTTSTTVTTMMYKKVTFTPLAAGGTLPLFINLKVGSDTYVLQPGKYYLADASGYLIENNSNEIKDATMLKNNFDSNKAEVHRWFGQGYPSTTMINTGLGVNGVKASTCEIYVKAPEIDPNTGQTKTGKDGFRINIFDDRSGNFLDNYDVWNDQENVNMLFYVSVDQDGNQGSIYDDIDEFRNIYNQGLGASPQSFIINSSGGTNATWKWPQERKHILQAYPHFVDWVGNKSNTTWTTTDVNTSLLYNP